MPDAVTVYRRALASRPDASVVICSVGALSNLEDLLRSAPDDISPLPGAELIRQKVRQTVIMGGGFPRTANPETNIKLDPAAAVTVVNEWPGPVLWQGYEVGYALITGTELLATPTTNPVRRAFELRPHHGRPALEVGKPSHDQAAVLAAVRGPQPDLWTAVEKGRVVIDSDGHTHWNTDWAKRHRYLKIQGHPAALTATIGELMSRPPKLEAAKRGDARPPLPSPPPSRSPSASRTPRTPHRNPARLPTSSSSSRTIRDTANSPATATPCSRRQTWIGSTPRASDSPTSMPPRCARPPAGNS